MASGKTRSQTPLSDRKTVPFLNAEEAWFWFIAAQEAKNEGVKMQAGQSLYPRPCEPIDILKTLDRLHRSRRLFRDHLLVLRHYGRRYMAPDPRRVKEARAHTLWCEALERLEIALEKKEIVKKEHWVPRENWHESAVLINRERA